MEPALSVAVRPGRAGACVPKSPCYCGIQKVFRGRSLPRGHTSSFLRCTLQSLCHVIPAGVCEAEPCGGGGRAAGSAAARRLRLAGPPSNGVLLLPL